MPIGEAWQLLLVIAGGIVTLTAAGSALVKLLNPYKKLVARLDEQAQQIKEQDAQLKKHGELFAKDLERFMRNDEKDNIMFDVLFALLEHARTNNSKGLMEAASKKLQAFLIERK